MVATVVCVRCLNAVLEVVLISSLERLIAPAELSGIKGLLPMLRTLIWVLGAWCFYRTRDCSSPP